MVMFFPKKVVELSSSHPGALLARRDGGEDVCTLYLGKRVSIHRVNLRNVNLLLIVVFSYCPFY